MAEQTKGLVITDKEYRKLVPASHFKLVGFINRRMRRQIEYFWAHEVVSCKKYIPLICKEVLWEKGIEDLRAAYQK